MSKKLKFGWYELAGGNIFVYAFDGAKYSFYDARENYIRDFDDNQVLIQALHPIALTIEEVNTISFDLEKEIEFHQKILKETKLILKKVKKCQTVDAAAIVPDEPQ